MDVFLLHTYIKSYYGLMKVNDGCFLEIYRTLSKYILYIKNSVKLHTDLSDQRDRLYGFCLDIVSLLLRAVQDEEKMSLNAHPIIRWISIHLGKKIQVGVDKQFSSKMTKTFPSKKDESLKKKRLPFFDSV